MAIYLKKCTKCKQDKPATLEFFYKQSSAKDGLTFSCRVCRKSQDGEVYLRNKDLYVTRAKTWNKLYRDKPKSEVS